MLKIQPEYRFYAVPQAPWHTEHRSRLVFSDFEFAEREANEKLRTIERRTKRMSCTLPHDRDTSSVVLDRKFESIGASVFRIRSAVRNEYQLPHDFGVVSEQCGVPRGVD